MDKKVKRITIKKTSTTLTPATTTTTTATVATTTISDYDYRNIEKTLHHILKTSRIIDREMIDECFIRLASSIKSDDIDATLKTIIASLTKLKEICYALINFNMIQMEFLATDLDKKFAISGVFIQRMIREQLEQFAKYKNEYLTRSDAQTRYVEPNSNEDRHMENKKIKELMEDSEPYIEFCKDMLYHENLEALRKSILLYNFILCRIDSPSYAEQICPSSS